MRNRAAWSVVAVTCLGLASACGTSSGTANGSGGVGNASGAAGAATGGVGTQSGGAPTGGSGAEAGQATGGAAGLSGAGGSSGVPAGVHDLLSSSLPTPSYDCRTDTTSRECVSVAGTIAGSMVDRHLVRSTSPSEFFGSTPNWVAGGYENSSGSGYLYEVEVPVQHPGTFDHVLTTGQVNLSTANLQVGLDSATSDAQADNFMAGEVAGWNVTDPSSGDDVIVGTFTGSWSDPDANCFPSPCVGADVQGTFRVDYALLACGAALPCVKGSCSAVGVCMQ